MISHVQIFVFFKYWCTHTDVLMSTHKYHRVNSRIEEYDRVNWLCEYLDLKTSNKLEQNDRASRSNSNNTHRGVCR